MDGLGLLLLRALGLPERRFVLVDRDARTGSDAARGAQCTRAPRVAPRRRADPRARAHGDDAPLVHERPLRHQRRTVHARVAAAAADRRRTPRSSGIWSSAGRSSAFTSATRSGMYNVFDWKYTVPVSAEFTPAERRGVGHDRPERADGDGRGVRELLTGARDRAQDSRARNTNATRTLAEAGQPCEPSPLLPKLALNPRRSSPPSRRSASGAFLVGCAGDDTNPPAPDAGPDRRGGGERCVEALRRGRERLGHAGETPPRRPTPERPTPASRRTRGENG